MGFFDSIFGTVNSCKVCSTKSGLSDYSYQKIHKSRIIEEGEIAERSGTQLRLTNGEVINPTFAHKMGSMYCYWINIPSNLDPNNVTIISLCSRKCAKSYSKSNKYLIIKRGGQGLSSSDLIFPQQEEMDSFQHSHNVRDRGFEVS